MTYSNSNLTFLEPIVLMLNVNAKHLVLLSIRKILHLRLIRFIFYTILFEAMRYPLFGMGSGCLLGYPYYLLNYLPKLYKYIVLIHSL